MFINIKSERNKIMCDNCLFCKIINGDIPSKKVYENEFVYAFHDIAPQAPVHVLVIPKCHIESCNDVNAENVNYVCEVFKAIPEIASLLHLEDGYRVVSNVGENGCQSVKHIHFHVLGGKKLSETMS